MEMHYHQTRSRCRYINSYNMANRKLLLYLLIISLALFVVECKFRRKSPSGSRSRFGPSRRGSGPGSSGVKSPKVKPSIHSPSSRIRSTTHKQPSAITRSYGLSRSNTPIQPFATTAAYDKHKHRNSSRLSGSNISSQPSAITISYDNHKYSKSTGFSGSTTPKTFFELSNTTLNTTTSYIKPSLPADTRSKNQSLHHPPQSYDINTSYKPGFNNNGHGTQSVHLPLTYYTSPQYVYVNQYRNSDSRYGDLLTGLALYNMGRSHNHHHEHYYYDDYYSRRSNKPNNNFKPDDRVTEKATCILKITEKEKENVLRIPCEIVSTFTKDGENMKAVNIINSTVCTTNSTITKSIIPVNISTVNTTMISSVNQSLLHPSNIPKANETVAVKSNTSINSPVSEVSLVNSIVSYVLNNITNLAGSTLNSPILEILNITAEPAAPLIINDSSVVSIVNSTVKPAPVLSQQPIDKIVSEKINSTSTFMMQNVTEVNVTVCTSAANITDPLTVQGPRLNPSNIVCVVEIHKRNSYLSKKIDCNTLLEYAKMPEPKKESDGILPSRQQLKS